MRPQWKSVGISAGMITINILLMLVLSYTAIPGVASRLFDALIVGVLVFGALLTGGAYLAQRGIRDNDTGIALLGVGLLQLGYGAFGAMIVTYVPPAYRVPLIAVTAVITTTIAVIAALYVYHTDRDLTWCRTYAGYAFLGVIAMALIGTFSGVFALVAFVLALAGFLLYLVYEIWDLQTRPENVLLNGIGIYTAFMGVFVHILQLVVRMYADRR